MKTVSKENLTLCRVFDRSRNERDGVNDNDFAGIDHLGRSSWGLGNLRRGFEPHPRPVPHGVACRVAVNFGLQGKARHRVNGCRKQHDKPVLCFEGEASSRVRLTHLFGVEVPDCHRGRFDGSPCNCIDNRSLYWRAYAQDRASTKETDGTQAGKCCEFGHVDHLEPLYPQSTYLRI